MKLLKTLFAIHSPSGKENKMRKFLKSYIKRNIPGTKCWGDRFGNLYIVKGKANAYPCCVAHLDQVQPEYPLDYVVAETKDILLGYSHSNRTMCGLGADDAVGIWCCLKCLERFDFLKVALFANEEKGCVGSSNCDMKFFDDTRFIVEIDRRGNSDLITEIGGIPLASDDFINAINPEQFGYKPQRGMMTDIEALRENGYPNSCVNLSCGYYNPHTLEEYVVKKDVLKCLDFLFHIIETATDVYPFADDGYLYLYSREEQVEELIDMLDYNCCIDPNLSAKDVYDWYKDMYPSLKLEDFERVVNELKAYHEPLKNNEDYGF